MNSIQRKGQAAIEFLVTYGWAILGVMVTIGALSYFGVFNTQKYVNDVCYFGDQLRCEDYVLYNDSWTSFQLRNNFGVAIDIINVTVTSDYGKTYCAPHTNVFPNDSIQAGTLFEVNCRLTTGAIALNNKLKYQQVITFQRSGSVNLHNQTGDLVTVVQKNFRSCSDTVRDCHGDACEGPSADAGAVCS